MRSDTVNGQVSTVSAEPLGILRRQAGPVCDEHAGIPSRSSRQDGVVRVLPGLVDVDVDEDNAARRSEDGHHGVKVCRGDRSVRAEADDDLGSELPPGFQLLEDRFAVSPLTANGGVDELPVRRSRGSG